MSGTKLFGMCVMVYDEMYKRASAVDTRIGHSESVPIYRGYLTYLFEELGLGISNYTPTMRRLQAMGCMRQLVRGGRGVPSQWELYLKPTGDMFARGGRPWVSQAQRIQNLEALVAEMQERQAS